MVKRGIYTIEQYISQHLKKGYSKEEIKKQLTNYGYDIEYIEQEFTKKKTRQIAIYFFLTILAISFIWLVQSNITGYIIANSDTDYQGLTESSIDYSSTAGLIYQGADVEGEPQIIGASITAKKDGSVNIIDYNNDGIADLFTTGRYKDDTRNYIPSSNLYTSFNSETSSFTKVQFSDSCWSDFNNDGFIEPAIIGQNNQGKGVFEIYANIKDQINQMLNLGSMYDGSIKCADIDNDNWPDIIASGISGTQKKLLICINSKNKDFNCKEETGLGSSEITLNDFNNDGFFDFIISGMQNQNSGPATYLFLNNKGSSFSNNIISPKLENPSVSSGDYANTGNAGFAVMGSEGAAVFTKIYKYENNEFIEDPITVTPLSEGKLIFLDKNQDNQLELFITGQNLEGTTYTNSAALISFQPTNQNKPPQPPTNLSTEPYDQNPDYIKFTWTQSIEDDHTKYLSYQVRAGDDLNPNKFLSGFIIDQRGNTGLNKFKLLLDPCQQDITLDHYSFSVKAIDGAFAESDWSQPKIVSCKTINTTNTTNQTIEPPTGSLSITSTPSNAKISLNGIEKGTTPLTINNLSITTYTISISKDEYNPESRQIIIEPNKTNNVNFNLEKINITQEIEQPSPLETWEEDALYDGIRYHAVYTQTDSANSIEETITNEDTSIRNNIIITHTGAVRDRGSYSRNGNEYEYYIGMLKPGQRITLHLTSESTTRILYTSISSVLPKPEIQPLTQNATAEIKVEENKTIITLNITFNESILAAKDIYVKQTIPKCLLEKINEMVAESNRQFVIINEDPVIMWHFDNIVDAEKLKLEIKAVADENCTNQIITEIVAKKYIIQKDRLNPINAIVLFVSAILITLCVYFFIESAKEYNRKVAIVIGLLLVFTLEILDTLSMLPASIDFLKKLMSWMTMLALLYHVSLKTTLFSGKDKNDKATNAFNILVLVGFVAMSIKNITYVAFISYAKEKWFSDLLLPIILYSKQLENYVFLGGALIIFLAAIYVIFGTELSSPSFASLIHKTEYSFVHSRLKKFFYVLLIFFGFYIAFFNFLFDWFAISFDAPMLVLTLLLIIYALVKHKKEDLREVPEKTDTFIQKFIKLFTHEKNMVIAFSAFPIFIFIIEIYNYIVYILFGIKSVYFEGIEFDMPTLFHLKPPIELLPLYLLEIAAMISAVMLAFLFWWHFFIRKEHNKEELLIKDRPSHPFLFSIFITGTIAFILRPCLDINILKAASISGLIISLKDNVPLSNIFIIYIALSIILVSSYLLFKNKIKANILPYAALLAAVLYVTALFISSFFVKIDFTQLQIIPFSVEWINLLILTLSSAVYLAILLFSAYCLIGEFLALVKEEFNDHSIYRKLMLALYPHKVTASEELKLKIKAYMEYMLEQGEEDYLIIEQIHEKANIPLREISRILKDLEEDDEKKERYHTINHYHHNIQYIRKLHKHIAQQYKNGVPAENIIDNCLMQGWSQDDIAAAMMHISYKKSDKILFEAMKKVSA